MKNFKINLQLFADVAKTDDNTKQQDNSSADNNVQSQDIRDKVMSILNTPEEQQNSSPENQTAAPGQTPDNAAPDNQAGNNANAPIDPNVDPSNGLILGKFKSMDELAQSYKNLEGFSTKNSQQMAELKASNDQLTAAVQQLSTQNADNANAQQPESPEGDPTNITTEDFMDSFYSNPQEAISKIINDAIQKNVNPQIQPLIQKNQQQTEQENWNKNVSDFAGTHDDFHQMQPAMQEVLKQYPEMGNDPTGLEKVYQMARGSQYKDPNTILSDENFVNNNVMNNDAIKQKIINDYLQGIQQNNQAPNVISGQTGGNMQISPENKPQNMSDARQMVLKMFGK